MPAFCAPIPIKLGEVSVESLFIGSARWRLLPDGYSGKDGQIEYCSSSADIRVGETEWQSSMMEFKNVNKRIIYFD